MGTRRDGRLVTVAVVTEEEEEEEEEDHQQEGEKEDQEEEDQEVEREEEEQEREQVEEEGERGELQDWGAAADVGGSWMAEQLACDIQAAHDREAAQALSRGSERERGREPPVTCWPLRGFSAEEERARASTLETRFGLGCPPQAAFVGQPSILALLYNKALAFV